MVAQQLVGGSRPQPAHARPSASSRHSPPSRRRRPAWPVRGRKGLAVSSSSAPRVEPGGTSSSSASSPTSAAVSVRPSTAAPRPGIGPEAPPLAGPGEGSSSIPVGVPSGGGRRRATWRPRAGLRARSARGTRPVGQGVPAAAAGADSISRVSRIVSTRQARAGAGTPRKERRRTPPAPARTTPVRCRCARRPPAGRAGAATASGARSRSGPSRRTAARAARPCRSTAGAACGLGAGPRRWPCACRRSARLRPPPPPACAGCETAEGAD